MRLILLSTVFGVSLLGQATFAAGPLSGQSVPVISMADRLQWFFALILVLGLFFSCIWILRKVGAVNTLPNESKLHIVSGISLGMREKVVLLQVGKKQLLLSVTPGRIETLTVLEGDECLESPHKKPWNNLDSSFAQKLMQSLKGQSDV